MKKFFIILAVFLLALLSCSQFSEEKDSPYTISGKISSSLSSTSSKPRMALPSFSAEQLVYHISAFQKYDGASYCEGTVQSQSDGSLSYSITVRSSGTWDLYVRASLKDGDSEKTVLSGAGEYNTEEKIAPTISLTPIFYETGNLNLTFSEQLTSYTLDHAQYAIDGDKKQALSFIDHTATISLSVSAGTHRISLYFYDSNGYLLYSCVESVSVIAGFTTETWAGTAKHFTENNSGSKDFILTDNCVTAFQSNSYWVDSKTGDDSTAGSPNKKFKTIQSAVNRLLAFNDGETRYKIYYFDEVKDDSTDPYSAENHYAWVNIESEIPFYLEIVSLNGGGERQKYITANGTGRVFYIGANVDVLLSNSATLSGGGNVEKGGGAYVASGGKLTLKSTDTIEENSATLAGSEDVYVENGGVIWFKQWNYVENLYLEKGAELWACQTAGNSDGTTNLTLSDYDTSTVWMKFWNYPYNSETQKWEEDITELTDEWSISSILNRIIVTSNNGKSYKMRTDGHIEEY